MSTDIISLAHSIRPELKSLGISIRLGHTHQLLAAALGYKSMAALQGASEPLELDSSMYWLVDVEQLRGRAASLGQVIDADVFTTCLATTSRRLGGAKVCASFEQLQDEVTEAVQDAATDDEEVGIRMAETNCTGPFMAYMEAVSTLSGPLPAVGGVLVIDYEGTVDGDQDTERPFSGDSVDVKAQARLPLLDRRLTGQPEVEILDAALDWSWAMDEDERDAEPTFSKVEALVYELGIPSDQAERIDDAEITQHTTSAGVPVGYLVDIANCESFDVVEQLVKRHGTRQIWVLGSSFERMRQDPNE